MRKLGVIVDKMGNICFSSDHRNRIAFLQYIIRKNFNVCFIIMTDSYHIELIAFTKVKLKVVLLIIFLLTSISIISISLPIDR